MADRGTTSPTKDEATSEEPAVTRASDPTDQVLAADGRRESITEHDGPVALDAPIEQDRAVEQPQDLDPAAPAAGIGNAHQQDLVPDVDGDHLGQDEDDNAGGPSIGSARDQGPASEVDLAGGPRAQHPGAADLPFDAEAPLAEPDIDPGGLSEHEQDMFAELDGDPLTDPFSLADHEVPDEYDLSGSETGDDYEDPVVGPDLHKFAWSPTQYFKDLFLKSANGETLQAPEGSYIDVLTNTTYEEGQGLRPKTEEEKAEKDPDAITVQEEKERFKAEEQKEKEQQPNDGEDPAAQDPGGDDEGEWETIDDETPGSGADDDGWVDMDDDEPAPSTEDRSPDSVWGPRSPSHDSSIGDTYFGIGQWAEGNSEIQYADMPEDGEGHPTDYDGIDYGDDAPHVDIDEETARMVLTGDPMTQPDVDPVDSSVGSQIEDESVDDGAAIDDLAE